MSPETSVAFNSASTLLRVMPPPIFLASREPSFVALLMLPPTFSAESFPLISSAATLPPTAETLTFVPLETATLFVMSFAVTSFSATDIRCSHKGASIPMSEMRKNLSRADTGIEKQQADIGERQRRNHQ
ncbi:hypothetical protein P3B99_008790 [Opitutia bacterium KCR 482]|nr:hypothetical protein [Opitutae bacterium KCR 482]